MVREVPALRTVRGMVAQQGEPRGREDRLPGAVAPRVQPDRRATEAQWEDLWGAASTVNHPPPWRR